MYKRNSKRMPKAKKQTPQNSKTMKNKPLTDESLSFDDEDEDEEEFDDDELDNDDDLDEDEDEDEDEEVETLSPSRIFQSSNHSDEILDDVFAYGEQQQNAGTPVKFTIYKNGALLSVVELPFGAIDLQRVYGAGLYRVVCKNAMNGRILKQGTLTIAADPLKNKEEETEKKENSLEVLAILESQRKAAKDEAREEIEREKQMAGNQTALMVQMMKQSSDQSMALMQAMMQQNQLMITQMNQSAERMMQMMTALKAENPAPAQNNVDPLSLMKLMSDAENRGRELTMQMMTMVEQKATKEAERLSEIEALKSGKEPSMLEKMLERVLPVVAQAVPVPGGASLGSPAPPPVASTVQPIAPSLAQRGPVLSNPTPPRKPMPNDLKSQKLKNILVPYIGHYLGAGRQPEAEGAIKLMRENKFTDKEVLEWLTESQVLAVAREHKVPPIADPYLKKFVIEVRGSLENSKTVERTAANP